jgi:peptide deformylase
VIDLQDDDDEKREKGFYPLFLANPELIEKSTEVCSAIEGCLSVPDQRVDIVRSSNIKIRFLNYHNEKIELKTGGWLARAIQHEMDHLDGKLMIDYLSSIKKDIVIRKLKKHKRNLL